MNGFLKNGLLVVGGVVLGSMVTQKALVDTLHSKEIAMRQDWRKCQEIQFETRKDAKDVLDNLHEIISKYGHATLADFYNLAGMGALYEDCKFGWTSLHGAKIICTQGGYLVNLPRAKSIR